MSIRTILTCLLNESSAPLLSEAGASLAKRFDAHLTGLHTLEAIVIYPGIAMYVSAPTFDHFNDEQKQVGEAIHAMFEAATSRAGVTAEWRMIHAGAVAAAERMIESARAADLVVMARPDTDADRPDQRHALSRVIREGGRPVILVPPGGIADEIGHRVILAHAPTREAARAAFDLLPLLQPGAEVHVVHVGETKDELRDDAMTDLCAMLSRHGFAVTMTHRAAHGRTVAQTLMREAREVGADLIAAGAYGHSRTYDFFLGATTGELVREAELPVLFST